MTQKTRKEIAQRALGMVDLTDLTDSCNKAAIEDLCTRAQTPFGPVGAICIWPRYVAHAHKLLRGTGIPIATVVNFPGGNQSIDITVAETHAALDDGAHEIDMVIPYQMLKNEDEAQVQAMLVAMRTATANKALLKVIIEAGELKEEALIHRASDLAIQAGADFIKTSTGKVPVNATPEFAKIMINAIAESKKQVGFKPAGGIKTTEDCGVYLDLADDIMGADWAQPQTMRFGASSVLDDLLSALDGGEQVTGTGY